MFVVHQSFSTNRRGDARVVAGAIQVRNKSADDEKTIEVSGGHGLHGCRRNLLVVHGFSSPRSFALLLFPSVKLGETAVVVVAQTPEVIEGHHLQVWPGENVRQLLADGFEDADSQLLLDALGKRFLDCSGFASTNPETRFRWAFSCGVGW